MGLEEIGLWVQGAAVMVALGASIAALWISARDRENARGIAEKDRITAIRHGQLRFEQDTLIRLAQILDRGGYTDAEVRRDKGAESQALIGAIGEGRLPLSWQVRVNQTHEELLNFVGDETQESWKRRAVEAHLALIAVSEEIAELTAENRKPRPHEEGGA